MSRWKVKGPTLVMLSCLVFIMLLIVVLPDVDLPDTAFHQGTAPLVVHARGTTAPPAVAVAALFQFPKIAQFWHPDLESDVVFTHLDPNFRPILFRSIRR
ncbi:MAG: hypothetical protein LAP86_13100 [Acidobacteriia bacterium]|nr:hypothetical protein [Terriglobia bacterium]